jgi:hypothetical protein
MSYDTVQEKQTMTGQIMLRSLPQLRPRHHPSLRVKKRKGGYAGTKIVYVICSSPSVCAAL